MKKRIVVTFVILFALFFNVKTVAQIDSTTSVGGWKLKTYKNISKIVIFQDTVKGHDLRSRGYVEGKGSLRLQFTSSKSRTQIAEAKLVIAKTFTKELQFPLEMGFAYKFGYFGPQFQYSAYALYDLVLIGKSGIRYQYLNSYVPALGTTENGGWISDLPEFVDMMFGRTIRPTEPMVGMEIGISMNVDRADLNLDWLAFWYTPSTHLPDYGITVDSFEDSTIVGVEDEIIVPTSFSLSQNYPNPFNPSTTITFQLSKSEYVSLKVFDVLGREVETLVNEEKSVGEHSVQFNGSHLASGMYLYQINIGHGQFVQTKKMMLMK